MSYSLYWARNDGIGGHVWLSERDLRALSDEMLVQALPWPGDRLSVDGSRISSDELEAILAAASPEPATLADVKLWRDWLAFLEGATRAGGILVRS
ncbi:MAG: hypothetical protein ABR569_15425 [Gaiellaceae bacterium]